MRREDTTDPLDLLEPSSKLPKDLSRLLVRFCLAPFPVVLLPLLLVDTLLLKVTIELVESFMPNSELPEMDPFFDPDETLDSEEPIEEFDELPIMLLEDLRMPRLDVSCRK